MAEAELQNYGLELLASENTHVAILEELSKNMTNEKLQNKSVLTVEEKTSATHCDILLLLPVILVSCTNHDILKRYIIYIFRGHTYINLRAPVSLL